MKKCVKILLIILAVIVVLGLIAFGIWFVKYSDFFADTMDMGEKEWKTKEVYLDPSNVIAEMAIVPRWEEMTITQKYPSINYVNTTYDSSRNAKILSDKIGEKFGTATLTGHDEYTNKDYNADVTLYKLIDFPKECVIAVQFEGDTDYYVYTNAYYRLATLGDFMRDLKLKDIVSFGTVYYEYSYTDSEGGKQYQEVEFYSVDNAVIWEKLFNNLTVENIYKDGETYTSEYLIKKMSISVDIPLFGIKNISVSLTDKGYLITNILESGKGFYIGEDTIQAFMDYVIDNYEGYKIVYVDTKGNDTLEENIQIIESTENEKIMVTENTTDGYITKEFDMNEIATGENKTELYIP